MVDPITLGVTAASIFAKKVLEKLGDSVGSAVATAVEAIRQRIVDLLGESETLQQVEASPDSQIAVDKLAADIAKAAELDGAKADRLAAVVENVGADSGDHHGATFQVNVSERARVEKIFQANRDINIGKE